MGELNELRRCHCCGEHLPDAEEWFCPPDPRFDTPDGLGFCEHAYLRRVDNDWPIPSFRPWDEELVRRDALTEVAQAPRYRRRSGPRVCALPTCDEPIGPHRTYCSEPHRAAGYRLRRKGQH